VVNPEILAAADVDVVWVTEKGDSCDPFTKEDAGELQRRNYSTVTTRNYLRVVAEFPSFLASRPVRPRYPFFLPIKVLSRVFRGKFLAGLKTPPPQQEATVCGPDCDSR